MKRLAPVRAVRWPLLCIRCGSISHYVEDCTRMPAHMGMSQQERDLQDQMKAERNVLLLAGLAFVLALLLFGLLERVPS